MPHSHRRHADDTPSGQAAALGVAATLLAAGLTSILALGAMGSWQEHGLAPAAVTAPLTTMLLAGAALLGGWGTVVLAAATTALVRFRAGTVRGQATGVTLPAPVRVVSALLVAVVGITTAPAHATPTDARHPVVVREKQTLAVPTIQAPTVPAARSVVLAAPTVTSPGLPGCHEPGQATDGPAERIPQPRWTPRPQASRPAPGAQVGLVSTVPQEAAPTHVVVRGGDSLWAIAARHLGPQATGQDVAEEWPRWYAANRDLIGPDPDLIRPGQELVVPARTAGP